MAKVVILGGLGYVGTALCELYKQENHEVTVIDSNFNFTKVSEFIKADFKFYQRDIFNVADLVKDADVCYHLISETEVPQRQEDETKQIREKIYKIGVEGTRYLLENIPQNCKLIFPSSHVVYEGLLGGSVVDEEFPPQPLLSYSESKTLSEQDLIKNNKNFIIARLGSVYGLPANRWRIVANLFAKLTALNKKIKITNKNCLKPLIGIEDCARGLKFLAESNYNKEIFHLVNEHLTINEIALICKEDVPDLVVEYGEDKVENLGYRLSNDKLLKTGFKFNQNIKTEIKKMIGSLSE